MDIVVLFVAVVGKQRGWGLVMAKERWRVEAGRKGGLAKVPKGFAVTGKAAEAGKIGGKMSKRGKARK